LESNFAFEAKKQNRVFLPSKGHFAVKASTKVTKRQPLAYCAKLTAKETLTSSRNFPRMSLNSRSLEWQQGLFKISSCTEEWLLKMIQMITAKVDSLSSAKAFLIKILIDTVQIHCSADASGLMLMWSLSDMRGLHATADSA
jgi:hypothetical protein